MPDRFDELVDRVASYYSAKVGEHGTTHRGVDWNSKESQELRFAQLLRIVDRGEFSINDFGCGYGALAGYLRELGLPADYRGCDVSLPMIEHARVTYPDLAANLTTKPDQLLPADFTVASGIFNVKLETPASEWVAYVLSTLDRLPAISERGFAFNMLTAYSDPEYMRRDLYYGDPLFFLTYCRQRFSRNIALLHDYGLYEFTVLVRLQV